jgi:aminomethyltransferase
MGNRTPLYETHVAAGAKLVDFGGWDMPLHYGSQIEEHHAVRRDAGMFDVSHMCPADIRGGDARAFLRYLVANNVDRLTQPGKALYSCMLNHAGGVVDDLIVYFLGDEAFRAVVNASTAEKDLAWMEKVRMERAFAATVQPRRDLAMIAIQGPNARAKLWQVRPATKSATAGLGAFFAAEVGDLFIARTGYTGEDGFEVMLPAAFRSAHSAGAASAGSMTSKPSSPV